VHAGTKPSGDSDLALVVSDVPASVAAAFTTNKAVCAHIKVCRPRVDGGVVRGVVVSAGIANAASSAKGVADAIALAAAAADACGVPEHEMLVCATGKIGPRLPIEAMLPGIRKGAESLSREGGIDAARAIWTTDTKLKTSVRTIDVGGVAVTIGGIAKGAAMIAPAMEVHATMLAFLTTDGAATPRTLRSALGAGLPTTFNAITVDGSCSTNDTVLLMANGAGGAAVDDSPEFVAAVREVMGDLAYAIASDGEGASKVIRIRVTGAASPEDARRAAREVASSFLLRAALWAGEAKWGWVIQQLGQADVELDPDRIGVWIAGVHLAHEGAGTGRDQEAKALLEQDELVVEADLGLGEGSFEVVTCDITPEYPKMQLGT
jgi:glutamate N-acetyltransferase/amino-acid N-acetyltransferase